jgi:hypothetical protein
MSKRNNVWKTATTFSTAHLMLMNKVTPPTPEAVEIVTARVNHEPDAGHLLEILGLS